MLFLDTEGAGLHGPTLLIQYAIDQGPVKIHNTFSRPIKETLKLIEMICEHDVAAFHLTFDWFHMVQLYNVLLKCQNKFFPPYPDEYWEVEKTNPCSHYLRPKGGLDLMLWCQAGRYQYLMDRKDIRIRKVPRILAYRLANELEARVPLRASLFANYKDPTLRRWRIQELSTPDPDFVNVVLKFNPSKRLEVIAKDVLNEGKAPNIFEFYPDVEEYGYKPYGGSWVQYIDVYCELWETDHALKYARRDVEILQQLYLKFDKPPAGDVNSELAICVANCRWKGFKLDIPKCEEVLEYNESLLTDFPININSPKQVLRYIKEKLPKMQRVVMTSTGKKVLEKLAKKEGPAQERVKQVLATRLANSRIRLMKKLIHAGRFHVSNKIMGALSDRMSGSDGINSTGIPKNLRDCFPLADPGEDTEGGDFNGFEISIACAIYNDKAMAADFQKGLKMHALMAEKLFQMDYEDILMTDSGRCQVCDGKGSKYLGTEEDLAAVSRWIKADWMGHSIEAECDFCSGTGAVEDKYTKGKQAFFARTFGAQDYKISMVTGLPMNEVASGLADYDERYMARREYVEGLNERHMAMYQPSEGGKVYWKDPKKYAESLLGFKRDFSIEYLIMQNLFELAQDVPKDWLKIKTKISRNKKRMQTPGGAVASALYGAAFGVQGTIQRQAGNHEIQSTGAGITKRLQLRIWNEQPRGIHPPVVSPFNIHDEVQVTGKNLNLTDVVQDEISKYRELVPLLSMDWDRNKKTWLK